MNYRPLELVDTTLREGGQSYLLNEHRSGFSTQEKLKIARGLITYRVRQIEVENPVIAPKIMDDIRRIIRLRDSLADKHPDVKILCHVRCTEEDINAAIATGADGIHVYFGTSPQLRAYSHGKSLEAVAQTAGRILAKTRLMHPGLIIRFGGEDSFRTPRAELAKVYEAVRPYVDRISIPDTVGAATPALVLDKIKWARKGFNVDIEFHGHNDLGLANANALAAIEGGAVFIDTTIWGLGDRNGIASTTGLLKAVHAVKPELAGQYNLKKSYALNLMMKEITGLDIPHGEPVQPLSWTHVAGVHLNAMLRSSSAYELCEPGVFGVPRNLVLLSYLSGQNAIAAALNALGMQVEASSLPSITAQFKSAMLRGQNRDPAGLLRQIAGQLCGHDFAIPIKA